MRSLRSATNGNSVRLLLDTQILVWMVNGDSRLKAEWRAAIAAPEAELQVSAVIACEYTDLQLRRRLPVDETIDILVARFDLTIAPLPTAAGERLGALPPVHRDPVDRMLVAHALSEDQTLMTADANIRRYPVSCI